MYAIIETGGKQYRVSQGDEIIVEKIEGNRGDEVVFDRVLMVASGEDVQVGTPVIDGMKVIGEIVRQEKGPKIYVFHMKKRKGYRKKTGHRQALTRLRVKDISG